MKRCFPQHLHRHKMPPEKLAKTSLGPDHARWQNPGRRTENGGVTVGPFIARGSAESDGDNLGSGQKPSGRWELGRASWRTWRTQVGGSKIERRQDDLGQASCMVAWSPWHLLLFTPSPPTQQQPGNEYQAVEGASEVLL